MAQFPIYSKAPPTASDFPVTVDVSQYGGARTIEIDNASGLVLDIFGDGQFLRRIPNYIPRFLPNTGGSWGSIRIENPSGVVNTGDTLTVMAYDSVVVPPLSQVSSR